MNLNVLFKIMFDFKVSFIMWVPNQRQWLQWSQQTCRIAHNGFQSGNILVSVSESSVRSLLISCSNKLETSRLTIYLYRQNRSIQLNDSFRFLKQCSCVRSISVSHAPVKRRATCWRVQRIIITINQCTAKDTSSHSGLKKTSQSGHERHEQYDRWCQCSINENDSSSAK